MISLLRTIHVVLKRLAVIVTAMLVWAAAMMVAPPVPEAAAATDPAIQQWRLRNARSDGQPHRQHFFGVGPRAVLTGDWDGDGSDTVGVRRGDTWRLSNDVRRPDIDRRFTWARPADTPLVGDWNGDGVDTIGARRGSTWFLRNRNTSGPRDIRLGWARPGDTPLVGDWDGDGVDTIGARRGSTWFLRNDNSEGPADIRFQFGPRGGVPVVGDWDADGRDEVGLRVGNRWLLKHRHRGGGPDHAFRYGRASDKPVAGNWGGRGGDSIGVVRSLPRLATGASGPHVRDLQRRLRQLDYWVGPVDGVFGTLTQQAVWAFQKVQRMQRDGEIGAREWRALDRPRRPRPRSDDGFVVEVNEARQILLLVRDGTVRWIFNTSTGTNDYYTYGGERYLAETPNGRWRIYRQIDGWRVSHLGRLYRPKYFHTDGIAIHGYTFVPPYPASHGCVRVSMDAMNWLWTRLPIGTDVWVYGGPVF